MSTIKTEDLPHYTYEDYRLWEGKWELIRGIAYAMVPAPSVEHQRVSQRIASLLEDALDDCAPCQALLPVDWKISEDTVVQPDNLVICYPAEGAYLTKAPTLIFEILSESTAHKDRKTKYEIYEREGVKYYVVVDPAERLAKVYELVAGRYAKRADASEETIGFDLGVCTIRFDFGKIWK